MSEQIPDSVRESDEELLNRGAEYTEDGRLEVPRGFIRELKSGEHEYDEVAKEIEAKTIKLASRFDGMDPYKADDVGDWLDAVKAAHADERPTQIAYDLLTERIRYLRQIYSRPKSDEERVAFLELPANVRNVYDKLDDVFRPREESDRKTSSTYASDHNLGRMTLFGDESILVQPSRKGLSPEQIEQQAVLSTKVDKFEEAFKIVDLDDIDGVIGLLESAQNDGLYKVRGEDMNKIVDIIDTIEEHYGINVHHRDHEKRFAQKRAANGQKKMSKLVYETARFFG